MIYVKYNSRKLGSFVFFMSQRDPKKLMFWGGEYTDEFTINQGRRAANMSRLASSVDITRAIGNTTGNEKLDRHQVRKLSIMKFSGMFDVSKSTNPLFDYRIISCKPLISIATFCLIKVGGIAGPTTIALQHTRGLIALLMNPYQKIYLSINGCGKIKFFKDRKTTSTITSILLSNLIDYSFELDGIPSPDEGYNKTATVDIILTFNSGEKLYIRYKI